jgi:hypothetical protein
MTEYIVKLHFWLCCSDTLMIEAATDAEAVEMAKREAAAAMQSHACPDFIDYDERREGLISYIDRIVDGKQEEFHDVIIFDEDRLYPDWHDYLTKIAALPADLESDEAKAEALRQYILLIEEAKRLHGQLA